CCPVYGSILSSICAYTRPASRIGCPYKVELYPAYRTVPVTIAGSISPFTNKIGQFCVGINWVGASPPMLGILLGTQLFMINEFWQIDAVWFDAVPSWPPR